MGTKSGTFTHDAVSLSDIKTPAWRAYSVPDCDYLMGDIYRKQPQHQ